MHFMNKKLKKTLIFFFGALGGLLFGYDTGVISGALLFIGNDIPLTEFDKGLIVSILLLAAIIGSLTSGKLTDRFGRRKIFLTISVIYIIGAIGCAVAPEIITLLVSRFILGFAVGGSATLVPVYLTEMAPSNQRGQMATLNNLMIVIGILLAYVTNYLLTPIEGWRWMLGLAAVPAAIMFFGSFFIPESPRWLMSRGKRKEAIRIMHLTRNREEVSRTVHAINKMEEKYKNEDSENNKGILKEKWLRPILFIGAGLAVCQQIMGINQSSIMRQQSLQRLAWPTVPLCLGRWVSVS